MYKVKVKKRVFTQFKFEYKKIVFFSKLYSCTKTSKTINTLVDCVMPVTYGYVTSVFNITVSYTTYGYVTVCLTLLSVILHVLMGM